MFVEGDLLWRLPLLLGSSFFVTSSSLWFLGCKDIKVFGGSGSCCFELFPFDLFVVCTTAHHVVLSYFCVLVVSGPITFALRSGVGVCLH